MLAFMDLATMTYEGSTNSINCVCETSFILQNTHKDHTDKKENQIFLIYKEIQNRAVVKSYMTNGLLIYGETFAHFLIY